MFKLIEVIKSEQLINDSNIIFSSKVKGRKYIILDFLSKTPEKKENILLGIGEKFKYIQEFYLKFYKYYWIFIFFFMFFYFYFLFFVLLIF